MVALTEKRYDMALTQEGTRTMTKKLSCLNRQRWPKPPMFLKDVFKSSIIIHIYGTELHRGQ